MNPIIRAKEEQAWVRKAFPISWTRPATSTPSPIIAVAARYKKKLDSLSGDPDSTVAVTALDPSTARKVCEVILSGLDPYDRRQVKAAISVSGDKKPVIPWMCGIPADATTDQARRILNGMGTLLLSLGSSSGEDSVAKVNQRASAMASRTAFASDPAEPASACESTLASLLLQAFTVDPELRDRIFASAPFQKALKSCVDAAEIMRAPESLSGDPSGLESEVYDCIKHKYPLGGLPLKGGLKDAWNALWKGATEAGEEKIEGGASGAVAEQKGQTQVEAIEYYNTRLAYYTDTYTKLFPNSSAAEVKEMAKLAAAKEAMAKYPNSFPASLMPTGTFGPDGSGSEAGTVTADSLMASKQALEKALNSLGSAKASVDEYQEKVLKQALVQARLQWANEILNANDDVAKILAYTTPSMHEVGPFLTTIMSVLPAARKTGNTSTLRSLVAAVRAAVSNASVDENALATLFNGDPDTLDADDPTLSAIDLLNVSKA